MDKNNNKQEVVISSISFNKDSECLLCTTSCGFIVYNVNPFNCMVTRNFTGGIRMGKMYKRSNLFFLNGTGLNSEYPINRICLWDDQKQKKIAEVSLNSKVISLYVSDGPHFIVSSYRKVYIYDIDTLTLIKSYDVCSFSLETKIFTDDFILCHVSLRPNNEGSIVIRSKNKYFSIDAHGSSIGKLSVSNNGKYIATSSINGQVIKLFKIDNGDLVTEFRRGTFAKVISYLGFSDNDNYLLCGTNTGSIHVFNIQQNESSLNTLWGILRRRSSYNINISEEIISIKLLEMTKVLYIITKSKFYSGKLIDDNIILEKTSLLIYKKDPFTPSPKRNYKGERSKSINIEKNSPTKTISNNNDDGYNHLQGNIISNSI